MSLREEQCKKVCRILDDVLANRPTERDSLIVATRSAFSALSAEPEIIRCKDCKHFIREDIEEHTPYGYNTHFHAFCDKHWDREQGEYIDVNLDDFCSFAERREVTT